MFRKKDDDTQEELDVATNQDQNKSDNNNQSSNYNNNDASKRPAAPRAAAPTAGYRPGQAPARAGGAPGSAPASRPGMAPAGGENRAAASPAGKNKRILTVGNDILLKGEIATCDRLVIEGMVDASLKDVHTVEISETGSFKGNAEIQDAEISGLFDGELIVKNRLTIYATGKVRGKISYGEVEIERGGELSGEIRSNSNASKSSDGGDKKKAA